ncbi:MAG: hypothetical protein QOG62_1128 [Thermoleophilaceae bacterium]|jgi:ketosteroid isomerase-like protein|nr:hypothetical protein [Thermoleophilaceae bacterium]
MSHDENIEIVQRTAAVFSGLHVTRDAKILDLLDPEIEMSDYPGFPDAEIHRGLDGAVKFAVKLWDAVSDLRYVPSEFIEAPQGALVCRADVGWTGKMSGLPVDTVVYSVWQFRGGKVLHFMTYNTKAEALEAVGLSE